MTVVIGQQPQLTLTAPGVAVWLDVPVPHLTGSHDALVRPVAVATCDLDTAINANRFALPLPYALGHEFVAEVVETSPDVSTVRPGDLVAVPFQISCGTCARCRRGLTGDCTNVPPLSMYGLGALGGDWGGAVTEMVRVPYADAMLVPIPDGVAPEMVASLDNLPDAWRAVGPYLPGLDDKRVLVFGGASIGLYTVAIAWALGAEVTYLGPHAETAARLGATIGERDGRLGPYPITVPTSGRADDMLLAIRATEPAGICIDTGIHAEDVALPLFRMYTTGVTFVTGRVASRHHLPAVLDLVATGRLDPSAVTATTVRWDDAPDAWSAHRAKLVLVR